MKYLIALFPIEDMKSYIVVVFQKYPLATIICVTIVTSLTIIYFTIELLSNTIHAITVEDYNVILDAYRQFQEINRYGPQLPN